MERWDETDYIPNIIDIIAYISSILRFIAAGGA